MQVQKAAQRREELIRQIRVKLLAAPTNKEAEELEQALREAMETIEKGPPRRRAVSK